MTEITPTQAQKLIRKHHNAKPPQRWQDRGLIEDYVQDMRQGNWMGDETSDDIIVVGPNGWNDRGTYFPRARSSTGGIGCMQWRYRASLSGQN